MSDTVKTFDDYAGDYDQWFDSPEGEALFSAEVEAVRSLTKGLEHPFLEIGVGPGRFAKALGIDFGIDPSVKMLIMAMKRGISTRKSEGETLPFPDDSFGAVFILFTICFVKDPQKVLTEAKRVLKSGGGLIIGFINRESSWGKFYMKKKAEGHPIYKYANFYTVGDVVTMIEKAGMKIKAFSSTLRQFPSEIPSKEAVHNDFVKDAGFVCILAEKTDSLGGK